MLHVLLINKSIFSINLKLSILLLLNAFSMAENHDTFSIMCFKG